MSDFVISCCSTADLTKEHFEKRDIKYICFHYELDGVQYPDDLGETIPFDKYFACKLYINYHRMSSNLLFA